MAPTIDYYLTPNSPYTYLGSAQFAELVARHGATVTVYPVQYGKIFPASGGLPLAQRAKQRQDYRLIELPRWRDFRGVAMNIRPAFFPADENLAARTVIAARESGEDALALSNAILRAVWAEEKNIADRETVQAIVSAAGLDAGAILAAADDPKTQDTYDADTERAIAIGVFGAPTYIVDGEMFWGQDRLEFVERKLQG